jgi:hypothetical protein
MDQTVIASSDLHALLEKAKEATPGVWEQDDENPSTILGVAEFWNYHEDPCEGPKGDERHCEGCAEYAEYDAAFVAAANPQVIIAIVTELLAARQALDARTVTHG